jgi:hypothetical protein
MTTAPTTSSAPAIAVSDTAQKVDAGGSANVVSDGESPCIARFLYLTIYRRGISGLPESRRGPGKTAYGSVRYPLLTVSDDRLCQSNSRPLILQVRPITRLGTW